MSFELIELGRIRPRSLGRPAAPMCCGGKVPSGMGDLEAVRERFMGGLSTMAGWVGLDKLSESLSATFGLNPGQADGVKAGLFIGVPSAVLAGIGSFGYSLPYVGRYLGRFGTGLLALGVAGMGFAAWRVYKGWTTTYATEADLLEAQGRAEEAEWLRFNCSQNDIGGWTAPELKSYLEGVFQAAREHRVAAEDVPEPFASLGASSFILGEDYPVIDVYLRNFKNCFPEFDARLEKILGRLMFDAERDVWWNVPGGAPTP